VVDDHRGCPGSSTSTSTTGVVTADRRYQPPSTISCGGSCPSAGSFRRPPARARSPSAAPSPPTSTARTTTASGSWCESVTAFTLVTPARGVGCVATPDDQPELFWATAGGIGPHRPGPRRHHPAARPSRPACLAVDTDRTPDLDSTLALMESTDRRLRLLRRVGRSAGSGAGQTGTVDPQPWPFRDARPVRTPGAVAIPARVQLRAPSPPVPAISPGTAWSTRPPSVRAFNEALVPKGTETCSSASTCRPSASSSTRSTCSTDWNRMYGSVAGSCNGSALCPAGGHR
jgi:hypothetical protein